MYAESELKQIKELREQGMLQRDIAASLGLSESGVRRRLQTLGMVGQPQTSIAKVKRDDEIAAKAAKQREAQLHKQLDAALQALETQRTSKVRIPMGARKRKGKPFCRVIIPDTHGVHIDLVAAAAFLRDLDDISPAEVVLLGDHLDCGGFLAAHHTENFIAETSYSFEDDVIHANEFLDQVQKRVGDVPIHYTSGNHERRVEKWCLTQHLRNQKDADFLMRQFGPAAVLGLQSRGIHYYEEDKFHHGLSIRGTIKLGRCHFTHGSSTAKHSASAMVDKFGGNVVFGHTHRCDSFVKRTVSDGAIGAWNPGCLCRLQPYYQLTNLSNWSHGYGLQLVHPDGGFLHINVPIVDGKSYLAPFTEA